MISFDSEKHLEDFICKYLDEGKNIINEDEHVEIYKRQFNTRHYGVIDIVTFTPYKGPNNQICVNVCVIELKNDYLKIQNIAQIARYKTFFERMSEHSDVEYDFEYVLACKGGKIPSSDCCYLVNESEWLSYYEFELDFDEGIKFTSQSGYFKTDEQFDFMNDIEGEFNEMV